MHRTVIDSKMTLSYFIAHMSSPFIDALSAGGKGWCVFPG